MNQEVQFDLVQNIKEGFEKKVVFRLSAERTKKRPLCEASNLGIKSKQFFDRETR